MFCLIFLCFAVRVALSVAAENLPVLHVVDNKDFLKYRVSVELFNGIHCAGTIILSNIVITVAHCVQGYDYKSTKVRVGSGIGKIVGDVYKIEKIITHPTIANDVSLVKLTTNIQLSETVGILSLATEEPEIEAEAFVSSWGSITDELGILSFIPITIRNKNECQPFSGLTEDIICAGKNGGGVDVCLPDFGGPLIVGNRLAGIVIWGESCERPHIYTNIATIRLWIIANIDALNA